MRDDQDHGPDRTITEAYQRLGTALAPPPDVLVGVERRIGARRRRRRTAVAAATVVILGGVVGGAVVLGNGDRSDPGRVATNTPTAGGAAHGGSFTLSGPDGSRVVIDDLTLSCERTPEGRPAAPGHIYLWSPVRLNASGDRLTKPYVSFDAIARQADGRDLILSADNTVVDNGHPHVLLYAVEAADRTTKQSNEASSAAPGGSGTIRVIHASCAPTPTLELEVDATLASEVHQGAVKVTGSYR